MLLVLSHRISLPTYVNRQLYTVILNEVKDLKYPEKQDSSRSNFEILRSTQDDERRTQNDIFGVHSLFQQPVYFSQKSTIEEIRKEVRTVAEKLKKVECDPKCGFAIQSHDEKEVVAVALQHAKKAHSESITEKDIRGMMKDA